MNTRQKKKQYKKRYGHNPPVGADGRYLFHVTYGLDLGTGQDYSRTLTPEQIKAIRNLATIKQEDLEHLRNLFQEAISTGYG